MNTLISVRTNILYSKKDKKVKTDQGEFAKHHELIFLVDKPSYRYSNEGEVIRERGIEELRFTVSEKAFGQLLVMLEKLKNIDESELG